MKVVVDGREGMLLMEVFEFIWLSYIKKKMYVEKTISTTTT